MRSSSSRVICFLAFAAIPAALGAAALEEGTDFAEPKAAVGQALDAAVNLMFKPGALDPNWNKNGVDLEKEVMSLAETELRYQALTDMTSGYFSGMKNVIREGK